MLHNALFHGFLSVNRNLFLLGFFEKLWRSIEIIEVYDVTVLSESCFLIN